MKDNKKRKRKLLGALLEALGEIFGTFLFFGVGAVILALFGVNIDADALDFDLIVLIGIVAPIGILLVICAFVQYVKKAFRGKPKEVENQNDGSEGLYDSDHRTDS